MLGKIVRFDDSDEAQPPSLPAPGSTMASLSAGSPQAHSPIGTPAPATAYPANGFGSLEGSADLDWLERAMQTKTMLFEFAQQEHKRCAHALIRVTQSLCPGVWDAQMRVGQNPESWPPKRIADLVIQHAGVALRNAQLSQDPELPDKYRQLVSELDVARAEVSGLRQRVQAAEDAVRQMKESMMREAFRRPAASAKRVEPDGPQPQTLPWPPSPLAPEKKEGQETQGPHTAPPTSSGDKRVDDVVRTIAETGLCRQKDIRLRLAAYWGLQNEKNVNRYIGTAAAHGYVELKRVELEWGGQPTGLMAVLTQSGQALALSMGVQMVKSQYERGMPLHMSEDHLYVILEIADILRTESFTEVEPFPSRIELPGGGQYHPDVVAQSPDGQTIIIEVERKTYKDSRADKWLRAVEVGKGVIHLATPNRDAQETILAEIRSAIGQRPDSPARVKAFNVRDYRAGQRHADSSLWIYQEQV